MGFIYIFVGFISGGKAGKGRHDPPDDDEGDCNEGRPYRDHPYHPQAPLKESGGER